VRGPRAAEPRRPHRRLAGPAGPRAHPAARATSWLVALALGLGATVAGGTATASGCPPPGFAFTGRAESAGAVVVFRTVPTPVEIGRHFAVEAVACPTPAGQAVSGLRVDAEMPEHRHGMNYRPRVTARGDGRFLAEGLLFHMPGRWQLVFHVERGGRAERLAADLVVE
jgi:hypothetical protein